jgi:hypothetical protein
MGEAGKKSFSIGVNRIDRGFHHDPTVAHNDVKAEKKTFIITRSGASHSLMKTVIFGTGLVRSGEISLKRIFSYF